MEDFVRISFIGLLAGLLIGCGSGSSSDPVDQLGGMTILIGDGPLEDVDEVNIDIGRMVLIGEGGQMELTDNATDGPINLLDLRNVTELLVNVSDVPAGNYTKIRTYIESLEIVGDDVEEGRFSDFAQLPANGKIDLLARGGFEISPGEDLVVEIDVDLHRSVHIVETGNTQYRFRPVVFIEVLDQRANLRLTKLFGTVQEVTETEAIEAGVDFNLCDTESNCLPIRLTEDPLALTDAGAPGYVPAEPDEVHLFGNFVVGASSADGIGFRALAVIQGAEETVAQINGDVVLAADDSIFSIGGTEVAPIGGALLLDGQGNPIAGAAEGDYAESWAQVDPTMDPFPSFLTLVGPALDEDSVSGMLISADAGSLTLRTDDLEEVCVLFDNQTQFQNVDGFGIDATTGLISLEELLELDLEMDTVEAEAFGTFQEGVTPACLDADVIVVETD